MRLLNGVKCVDTQYLPQPLGVGGFSFNQNPYLAYNVITRLYPQETDVTHGIEGEAGKPTLRPSSGSASWACARPWLDNSHLKN